MYMPEPYPKETFQQLYSLEQYLFPGEVVHRDEGNRTLWNPITNSAAPEKTENTFVLVLFDISPIFNDSTQEILEGRQ